MIDLQSYQRAGADIQMFKAPSVTTSETRVWHKPRGKTMLYLWMAGAGGAGNVSSTPLMTSVGLQLGRNALVGCGGASGSVFIGMFPLAFMADELYINWASGIIRVDADPGIGFPFALCNAGQGNVGGQPAVGAAATNKPLFSQARSGYVVTPDGLVHTPATSFSVSNGQTAPLPAGAPAEYFLPGTVLSIAPACLAGSNTNWCAVASDGQTTMVSSDAVNWTNSSLPSVLTSPSICWDGSVYIVVGSGSAQGYTSPDGITWSSITLPSVGGYKAMCLGSGGKLVALGALANTTSAAFTTNSGVSWTSAVIPSGTYSTICWSGTNFVSISSASSTTSIYSPDGSTWSSSSAFPTATCTVSSLASDGAGNVRAHTASAAILKLLSTTNGTSWVQDNTGTAQTLPVMVYGNGVFYSLGQGTAGQYWTGAAWTVSTNTTFISGATALLVAKGGPQFPVSGKQKWLVTGTANAICSTFGDPLDGGGFSPYFFSAPGIGAQAHLVSNGSGKVVAIGTTVNLCSQTTDAFSWSATTAKGTASVPAHAIFGGGNFIVLYPLSGASNCLISADGATWSAGGTMPVINAGAGYFQALSTPVPVLSFARIVAVGTGGGTVANNIAAYSDNAGVTWTSATMVTSLIYDSISFNPTATGAYVATGKAAGGAITNAYCYSSDGVTWNAGTIGSISTNGFKLFYMTYLHVAIGLNITDTPYTSSDGISWTAGTAPSSVAGVSNYGVTLQNAYTDGTYFYMPVSYQPNPKNLSVFSYLKTSDFNTWTVCTTPLPNRLSSCYDPVLGHMSANLGTVVVQRSASWDFPELRRNPVNLPASFAIWPGGFNSKSGKGNDGAFAAIGSIGANGNPGGDFWSFLGLPFPGMAGQSLVLGDLTGTPGRGGDAVGVGAGGGAAGYGDLTAANAVQSGDGGPSAAIFICT